MVIISTLTVIKLIRNLYLYVLFIKPEYYNHYIAILLYYLYFYCENTVTYSISKTFSLFSSHSDINGVKLKFLTYEHFAEMNVVEQH